MSTRKTFPEGTTWRASDALRALLPGFEFDKFPIEDCILPSPIEDDILNASTRYLCVLVGAQDATEFRLLLLTPYIAQPLDHEPGREIDWLYGWAELHSGGQYYDHGERDIHGDDQRVVAWKSVEEAVDWAVPKPPETS